MVYINDVCYDMFTDIFQVEIVCSAIHSMHMKSGLAKLYKLAVRSMPLLVNEGILQAKACKPL